MKEVESRHESLKTKDWMGLLQMVCAPCFIASYIPFLSLSSSTAAPLCLFVLSDVLAGGPSQIAFVPLPFGPQTGTS